MHPTGWPAGPEPGAGAAPEDYASALAALQRSSRLYAALSQVNQSIIRSSGEEELFASICRALVEGGGFWAAWIAAPDPETAQFHPLARHGGREGWVEGIQVYATDDREEGRGTMGRAYREDRPVIANDFEGDPLTTPWKAEGKSRDFKAVASFPLHGGDGAIFGVLCIYSKEAGYFGEPEIALLKEVCGDVTFALEDLAKERQQRLLEARIHQAEKLESLGALAGGIAHDMNNVLGAILGLASIEHERLGVSTPSHRSMETIIQACTRGREAVQGLLGFAKRDLGDPRPVDVNQLLREVVSLLSHTTLQRVTLVSDLAEDLLWVEGEPSALNHAFMNICVNAVDAMPRGGTLTLRTRNGGDGAVCVEFEDTGEGMTEEVMLRATEPFFSTKGPGKGTGLGLATVYGTVKAHQGSLSLASRLGIGTQVRLVFPGTSRKAAVQETVPLGAPVTGLRILLVDDDELLRESMSEVLAWQGHRPESVSGGQEALDVLARGLVFDLVILDLNMPGMSGGETLPKILELRPDMKILVSSGFSDTAVRSHLEQRPNVRTIGKPFTTHELSRKLQELI